MKKKPTKEEFAPMGFLDDELERYAEGFFNPFTEAYYRSLMAIRKAQNEDQDVLMELYEAVPHHASDSSAEYGYFMANIHYYLFVWHREFKRDPAYIDSLNRRILFFLENAEGIDDLKGWFFLSFPITYRTFLCRFYQVDLSKELRKMNTIDSLKALTEMVGNDDAKKIAAVVKEKAEAIRHSHGDGKRS